MKNTRFLNESELELFRIILENRGVTQERVGKILGGLTQEAISDRFRRRKFNRLDAKEVIKILKEEDKNFAEVNF